MKIAVMGSGGVGGFYGGRLAHAGCDVTFIARGAHLAAMRGHGLHIENADQGDIHVPKVSATDRPETVGPVDLVLIAVKLWDTEAATQAVRPMVGPRTAVLSLQNGVIKDDILRSAFGDAAVMGGVGYVATHISRPGVIHQTGDPAASLLRGIRWPPFRACRAPARSAAARGHPGGARGRHPQDALGEVRVPRRPVGHDDDDALDDRADSHPRADAQVPLRSHEGDRRRRARARRRSAGGLRGPAARLRRHRAGRHDFIDAPRSRPRQSARGRVALGRRGAARGEGGGAAPANRAVWDVLALHAGGRRASVAAKETVQ